MKSSIKLFITAAVTLLAGVACQRPGDEPLVPQDELVTIKACFPDETRGSVIKDGISWSWNENDILTISGENTEVYEIKEGFTAKQAEFTGKAVKGDTFSIAYPSTDDIDWSVQTQKGNGDVEHLRYVAVLEGVDTYTTFSFTPDWAEAHGGTLRQTGVLKFIFTFPDNVSSVSAITISAASPVFYAGNGDTMTDKLTLKLTGVTLTPGETLIGWMTTSWNEAAIPAGTTLGIEAAAGSEVMTREISLTAGATLKSGVVNTFTLTAGGWTGSGGTGRYAGGSGTQSDPWLISNATHMVNMNEDLAHGDTKYFKLVADVDMSSVTDWHPVNVSSPYDMAVDFNGNGHTVSNFTCNDGKYPSLFGVLNGKVYDLKLTNASVSSSEQETAVGIIAGYGGTSGVYPEVRNVHVQGSVTNSSAYAGIGGLFGKFFGNNLTKAALSGCSFTGTITNTGGKNGIGGLAGILDGALIERCWVDATITTNANYAGMLVGYENSKSAISNCWAAGSVTGSQRIGGIIAGVIKNETAVRNCYSTAAVSASAVVGGIVAHASLDKWSAADSQPGNVIEKCIAWNSSIKVTGASYEEYQNRGSSGVIIGYTSKNNYLTDCYRKEDIVFKENWLGNVPFDQENSSPATPLVTDTDGKQYNYPYHGKAAASGATLSSVAKALGWDENVWDLSSDTPKLKQP